MKLYKLVAFVIFAFYSVGLFAQAQADLDWWAQGVKWDGFTHWSRYIVRSPGYLGPNALPVPDVAQAKLGTKPSFIVSGEYHKGRGEMAVNPLLNINIPIAKGAAALDFIYRPLEYYETEQWIGLERRVRYSACKGTAKGDLYIGTLVQLFKQDKAPVDAVMEIYFKTTTGKGLANARHIDAPGYYFDLNVGRTFVKKDNGFLRKVRVSGIGGLYVWQADFDNNRQNDAILYGLRTDASFPFFDMSLSWAGYSGYMNLRDNPMVVRCTIEKKIKHLSLFLRYQKGLRDVVDVSLRAGIGLNLSPKDY